MGEMMHGGTIPVHEATNRRPGCPWCSTKNVEISVTALRRALGQALQLIVAYNLGDPDAYSSETWNAVQMEASRTNLGTFIHDPEGQARVAGGEHG